MSKNSINSPCLHVGSIDDDGDGDSVFINDDGGIDGDDDSKINDGEVDSIDAEIGVSDDSNVSRVVIGVLEVNAVE